ncbi:GNAT family N-acetyltransferase [Deinococcus hohokamensis]|uniref:GNAT family N-acetyltransferase n=1 Tax=Deinococcus hohokamensis TaxID=309883 RepID=A0ABV9I9B0_9DEIO
MTGTVQSSTAQPGTLTIRPGTDADLPTLARIMSEVQPAHPWTPETLAHELRVLREHPKRPHYTDWIAEQDGEAVAVASVLQFPGMFHPERYHAELMVRPTARGQGVGTRLAAVLEEHLRARGAQEVLAGAYEDQPEALAFLTRRGFTEAMRFFDNVLDLDTFDAAAWAGQGALPDGVRLVTLAALEQELGQEAARRAYHAGFAEAREDVPRTGEATPLTFEDFQKRFEGPTMFPEGIQLAVTAEGEVVGLSELWRAEGNPARLNTGLTGTRRAWRRRGLALALKLAALRVAREEGAKEVWTGNATTNAPMLALNDRLGFRPRPAFVEFKWGGV